MVDPHLSESSAEASTFLLCLNCRHPYSDGELYCAECGCILGHTLKTPDKTNLLSNAATPTGSQQRQINLEWGTSYFHPRARLSLYHEQSGQTIPVPLSEEAIILGRNTDATKGFLDLSPFGAAEFGVSRRHVKIMRVRDFLQAVDLDSSNGTFLNRTPLLTEVGYTLRNRAILQLGHMILRVQFS
jgi:hypothetical protein